MTTINIEPVTRIESHGRLIIEADDSGQLKNAYFSTPVLRGFEAFLKGAPIERVPWLASRICGVCPVSHAVTSTKTIEKALSIEIPDTAKILRELLVLSQVIDSHALSFVILSLPDLLPDADAHSVVDIKATNPQLFEKGMELHSIGRKMTSLIGGRNVHPVNVRIGGMAHNPLIDTDFDFHSAAGNAQEIGIEFLSILKGIFEAKSELVESLGVIPTNYMALSNKDKVSFVDGPVRYVGKDGLEISMFDSNTYSNHISESVASHTYMKLPYIKKLGETEGILRVNCLARANVNSGYGTTLADQELKELRDKWGNPLEHSLLSHWTRLIELIYATERIQDLLQTPSVKSERTAVDVTISEGEAVGSLEAPRGTLFHHYSIKNKQIEKANLIVATQNNAHAVNHALTQTISKSQELGHDRDKIVHHCEMVVRAYDPCISCSTHIVELKEEH